MSWLVLALVFIADRLSKFWVVQHLHEGMSIAWIPSVWHWTRVNNSGVAFGLGTSLDRWFFVAFSVVSVVGICIYILRGGSNKLAWAIVAGGALGNLVDRWSYGHVIDFIDWRVWPVFNIADCGITLGVAWILWRSFRAPRSR